MRFIGKWRTKLDKDFLIGAVLMDLFKAFDRISHDLLVAKLAAYGFEEKTLLYFVHLWKIGKKCVKIIT